MAQELVYTSAPKGLLPGTRGFCTVAATAGMSATLTQRLESLSGYRPMFGVGDPRAADNPVQWSHLRLRVGGEDLSVLSRVAYAGADYSRRANKLADHRVLDTSERSEAGPAWVLQQPGVMRPAWDAEPAIIEQPVTVPRGQQDPGVCARWADAAGDAGWAGVLAERFLLDPSQPSVVVYDPRADDALALIAEALALLPVHRRWDVTFSTYFVDPPPQAECAWRFVVAGTPAQQSLAGRGLAEGVLDLTETLPDLPATRYVCLARSGEDGGEGSDAEAITTPPRVVAPADPAVVITDSVVPPHEPILTETATPVASTPVPQTRVTQPPRVSEPAVHVGRWWVTAGVLVALLVLGGGLVWLSGGDAANRAEAGAETERARLEAELRASQLEIAELRAQLSSEQAERPTPSPRIVTPAEPPRPEAVPSPVPTATDVEPPVRPAATPTVAADRPVLEPVAAGAVPRIYSALPNPRVQRSPAVSLGATARLEPGEAELWASPRPLPSGVRLGVVSATLVESDALKLTAEGKAVVLSYVDRDALGAARVTELGGAALEGDALVWRWRAAALSPESTALLERGWMLARLSTFEVRDDGGRVLARVQGVGRQPVRVTPRGPASAAVAAWWPAGPSLWVDDLPLGWTHTADDANHHVLLTSPAGALLRVRLQRPVSPEGPAEVSADWEAGHDFEALSLAVAEHGRAAEHWRGLLEKHDQLRADLRSAAGELPRTPAGEIDHPRRDAPDWRPRFAAHDQAQDRLDRFMAKHDDPAPAAWRRDAEAEERALAQARAMLDDVSAFDGAAFSVLIHGSGAVVAEVRVEGVTP